MIRASRAGAAKAARGATVMLVCTAVLAAAPAKTFTEAEVTQAVSRLIAEGSHDGVYTIDDPGTGTALTLVFDEIRVVRGLPRYGWFPDVVFHEKDAPKKKYTVDFWLKPTGDRLQLMDVRVHKDAKPDGSSWMMITRAPLLWWWLPTLKRQSAVTGMQAWQVMGAVHEHIVETQKDGAYPLTLADGKIIPAQLVAIYQPVGKAKGDGRYFVCTELRNKGAAEGSFAVDFWLDPDAGSVSVGTARLFKNRRAGNGKAASEPPCRLEDLAFEVVE